MPVGITGAAMRQKSRLRRQTRVRRVGLEYGVLSMEMVGTTAVDVVAVAGAGGIFHGALSFKSRVMINASNHERS